MWSKKLEFKRITIKKNTKKFKKLLTIFAELRDPSCFWTGGNGQAGDIIDIQQTLLLQRHACWTICLTITSSPRTQRHNSSLNSVHVIMWLLRCAIFTGYQWRIALPTNSACSCTVSIIKKCVTYWHSDSNLRYWGTFWPEIDVQWLLQDSTITTSICKNLYANLPLLVTRACNSLPAFLHQTRSSVTFKRHWNLEVCFLSTSIHQLVLFYYPRLFLSHCSLLVMFLSKQTFMIMICNY